jgi:uncharacterized protein YigA (DUF484 family)
MNSTRSPHLTPDPSAPPDHHTRAHPIILAPNSSCPSDDSPEAGHSLASPDLPPPIPGDAQDADAEPDSHTAELLKSFDMLFQLHQRSEDIRSYLANIDHILLSARTVSALTGKIVEALERDLDLTAVRILFREDSPIATLLEWAPPRGVTLAPSGFLDNGGFLDAGPFVLDDPSADLAASLFTDAAAVVSSAAVAPLFADGEELGVLCLGSDDPLRYCGDMNTDLIGELANKIGLGIRNAWDHEKRGREAFTTEVEGVATESFFQLLLEREFDRAWRYRRPFSVMAVSGASISSDPPPSVQKLGALLKKRIRSSDLMARDHEDTLWLLLPETTAKLSVRMAERLGASLRADFSDDMRLCAGITEFSAAAPVATILLKEARAALSQAADSPGNPIVVRPIPEHRSSAQPDIPVPVPVSPNELQ